MHLCCNAPRKLGAALIIGLSFLSGAVAQSADPIRIGMSSCADRCRGITI